jgi:hypothetical protein
VHNDNLPPLKDAVVTMVLENETKVGTLRSLNDKLSFNNIPATQIGKIVRVIFQQDDFITVDTMMRLSKDLTIDISRNDSVYGNIVLRLFDKAGKIVANREIVVQNQKIRTDKDGVLRCFIPLENQNSQYEIKFGTQTDMIAPTYNLMGQSKTLNSIK